MLETILKKFGLNDKEIKIYLTCLKLGPAAVRKIAQLSGINRGTAYDILRSLIDLGLVSYYHQDKHQYFVTEDPKKLKDILEAKQKQLLEVEKEIEQIIPQLQSIYDKAGTKPVVKYYEGSNGIKTILGDVIQTCQKIGETEYYVYSSSTIKKYLYQTYPNFSNNRIKAKIRVKVISIGPGGEIRGLDERKWLTKKESAPIYTLIYGGKVAMISVDTEDKPVGVLIEDKNIYQTQKMIFEFIWGKL